MRLLASSVCGLFKWRQFEPEVILLAVGWYLRFSLSYLHIEWGGIEPLGFVRNLVGRHEEKFGVFVHELPDEPGAGHAIYFNSLSSNPFHGRSAPIISLIVVNSRRTCSGARHLVLRVGRGRPRRWTAGENRQDSGFS